MYMVQNYFLVLILIIYHEEQDSDIWRKIINFPLTGGIDKHLRTPRRTTRAYIDPNVFYNLYISPQLIAIATTQFLLSL